MKVIDNENKRVFGICPKCGANLIVTDTGELREENKEAKKDE